MPHIHVEPGQHDLTVSMFIVRTDGPEPIVLLHHHRKLGVWMQTGGHVELDETPWQTVSHELREETGYDLAQLAVLQPPLRLGPLPDNVVHPEPVCLRTVPVFDRYAPSTPALASTYEQTRLRSACLGVPKGAPVGHRHIDLGFAFVAAEPPAHPVAAGESAEIAWLTRGQVVDLPADQTYEDVRQIHLYILDRLLGVWQPVPATSFSLAGSADIS